ncbi:MAG: TIR domain-containing protein [Candidatus Lokiarchaeota archaeon]|nr:TIR domain-containing protein [Candidatus Lokiarchaeota archaeon]
MPSLKIFVASPGDVIEERDIVSQIVVPELRRIFGDEQIFGKEKRIDIEAVRWETHTWPDIGDDVQDVVNKQIGDFDILVGIMWKRFGTPTNRAESGTGEEFERAYQYNKLLNRPKIMFYFRTEKFYTTDKDEWEQFRKVLSFRDELVDLGVLFNEYESPIEFERNVREHLIRQIFRLYDLEPKPDTAVRLRAEEEREPIRKRRASVKVFISYAREDLPTVRNIYSSLKAAGYDPWLDIEDVLPGQDWMREIRKEIEVADAVLFILSKNSISKEGYVQKELKIVLDRVQEMSDEQAFLIPVRIDHVEPPTSLRRFQWLNYLADYADEKIVMILDRIAKRSSDHGG